MSETASKLPRASFHDDRLNLAHWYPAVRDECSVAVNLPQTRLFDLDTDTEDGFPEFDAKRIAHWVNNSLDGEAFVRSGYKSAQMAMAEGGHLYEPTEESVRGTVTELLSQHVMMGVGHGGVLAVREWLDLDFNYYARENLVPEVRVFIRDGEIVCHHARLEGFDREAGGEEMKSIAAQLVADGWETDVKAQAEEVADVLDGWWSVDWVMDRDGTWWCTDAALDAVYWLEPEERWSGISHHPGECEQDIEPKAADMAPPEYREGWR